MESGIKIKCTVISKEVRVSLEKQNFIFKPKIDKGIDLYKILQQSESEAS